MDEKEKSWRKGLKMGAVAMMLLLLVGGAFTAATDGVNKHLSR